MGFQQQAVQIELNRMSLTLPGAWAGNEACRLLSAPNQQNSNWRRTQDESPDEQEQGQEDAEAAKGGHCELSKSLLLPKKAKKKHIDHTLNHKGKRRIV